MREKDEIIQELRERLNENTEHYEKRTVILQKYLLILPVQVVGMSMNCLIEDPLRWRLRTELI